MNVLGTLDSLWRSEDDSCLDGAMVETLVRGCDRKLKAQNVEIVKGGP